MANFDIAPNLFFSLLLSTAVISSVQCAGCGRWVIDESLTRMSSVGGVASREVTLDDRLNCNQGDVQPPNRVDTSERVTELQAILVTEGFDAYIIPTNDEHQSEYVASADARRQYISGFSGSAGTAVVLKDKAALWTDGRYFLQADEELDCQWLLMKDGENGVPSISEWLISELAAGEKVGADSKLIGFNTWESYNSKLTEAGLILEAPVDNFVDQIWDNDGRPDYSDAEVFIHPVEFAGVDWRDKVAEVLQDVTEAGADTMVLTALDEVAWLLNLRGADIPYNPVFRSYVIMTENEVKLYIPDGKTSPEINAHLCPPLRDCVEVRPYEEIFTALETASAASTNKVLIGSQYAYSGGASYAIVDSVETGKRLLQPSPVLLRKAQKNEVEIEGMKYAHVKDGVALVDFLAFLEDEIAAGNEWTEVSAAEKLQEFRSEQEDFVDLSFETISGFGSNGAIIHYAPSDVTDKQITNESLYLLDSGGQYFDGTTDVTRTMHYGKPTSKMIEAYTRVLQGVFDLGMAIFPDGTTDSSVDILARNPLYSVGLDYRHGTGHGIGMFLNVHESAESAYRIGFFGSHEPGYYEDGEFGIRLETIVMVLKKITKYDFVENSLGFEAVTLAPYETKLIDFSMLTLLQCDYLNEYHERVLQEIGAELLQQNRTRGYEWLEEKTKRIECQPDLSGASNLNISFSLVSLAFLIIKASN